MLESVCLLEVAGGLALGDGAILGQLLGSLGPMRIALQKAAGQVEPFGLLDMAGARHRTYERPEHPGVVVTRACDVLAFPNSMRRVLSSFLLGVLAWSFVAPLAVALTTNTPAMCCRRDGKHHCMSGMADMAAADQPSFRTIPSRCPYSSQIATTTVAVALEASRTTAYYSPSEVLAVRTDSLVVDSGAHSRITQRGPPSEFLNT